MYVYKNNFIESYCGPFLDIESAISLKYFFNNFGCSNIRYVNDFCSFLDFRIFFQLNDTLINIENKTNILFLGTQLRLEAPLINARLRKSYLNNVLFSAYSFGLSVNHLTYPVLNLGIVLHLLFLI